MRHIVNWNGQKLKVQLPDTVPDGQAFAFAVEERAYRATWLRRHGILAVTNDAGVEQLLRVRSHKATRFDGEAETEVRAEVQHGPKTAHLATTVTFDVPGHANKSTANREQVVRSQITGKVLKVLVKPGDAVAQGQALLTIEAMKMENRVFAAAPGKVATVSVKDGDSVSTGKELVRITP